MLAFVATTNCAEAVGAAASRQPHASAARAPIHRPLTVKRSISRCEAMTAMLSAPRRRRIVEATTIFHFAAPE
jgi:hypothetical protein